MPHSVKHTTQSIGERLPYTDYLFHTSLSQRSSRTNQFTFVGAGSGFGSGLGVGVGVVGVVGVGWATGVGGTGVGSTGVVITGGVSVTG